MEEIEQLEFGNFSDNHTAYLIAIRAIAKRRRGEGIKIMRRLVAHIEKTQEAKSMPLLHTLKLNLSNLEGPSGDDNANVHNELERDDKRL